MTPADDLPAKTESDGGLTQHSLSAAPELSGPSGSESLPPFGNQFRNLHTSTKDAIRAYALAARAERDAEIEAWKQKYLRVLLERDTKSMQLAQRDERIRELQNVHDLEEWDKLHQRAWAAEARVKELGELRQNEMKMHTDAHRELTQERDTLQARIAELEEKLIVMCVAQLREAEPSTDVRAVLDLIGEMSTYIDADAWERGKSAGLFDRYTRTRDALYQLKLVSKHALVPSPDPPAPAPLAAQGIEGDPHHER